MLASQAAGLFSKSEESKPQGPETASPGDAGMSDDPDAHDASAEPSLPKDPSVSRLMVFWLHASFVSGRRSIYPVQRALVSGQLQRFPGEVHSCCRDSRHASGRPLFQERHERKCSDWHWHQAGCGGVACRAR